MSEENYMAKLANFMIDNGFDVGKANTFDDLLKNLKVYIDDLLEIERRYEEACSAAEDHRWD